MAHNANTFRNANTFQFATKGAFDRSRASTGFSSPQPATHNPQAAPFARTRLDSLPSTRWRFGWRSKRPLGDPRRQSVARRPQLKAFARTVWVRKKGIIASQAKESFKKSSLGSRLRSPTRKSTRFPNGATNTNLKCADSGTLTAPRVKP